MMPYEKLDAWQWCHRLVLAVYQVTKSFPDDERYGLTSQARRAAFSAAVNIVEGSVRRGRREFCRFVGYSVSSLAEVKYALRVAREVGILAADKADRVDVIHTRASQLTWRLYESLWDR